MKLEQALRLVGFKGSQARLLATLHEGPATSTELVAAGFSQPVVSTEARILAEAGLLRVQKVPREGKGRPEHHYSVTPAAKANLAARGRAARQRIEEAARLLEGW